MNEFKIFTKPLCPFCVRAKALIESKDDKYNEMVIGEDINREAFMNLYPEAKTVPQIVLVRSYDSYINHHIGGFTELQAWYNNLRHS